jgi:NAD-dependent deacetylase
MFYAFLSQATMEKRESRITMKVSSIKLKDYKRIVFFTGAGLSVESGIPTYRGQGGKWNEYRWEDYACQRAFDRDPERVWDFHEQQRAAAAACEPNPAHRIIAETQRDRPETVVITQNIDGLLQRAGCTQVNELHGSLWRLRCPRERAVREDFGVPLASRRCACGAYWRPDIVWFEDPLDNDAIDAATEALLACDLLVSIGTSGAVFPAADLPRIAVANGAASIEVNPGDTMVSHLYDLRLRGKASDMLREMAG